MPYVNSESGDFEKLTLALQELTSTFGSVDNALQAFGLNDMPLAQRYGILFGCLTFVCTVTAVLILLTLGGSFKRIQEQEQTGHATLLSPTEARVQRALLLEQLLQSREYMLKRNYPNPGDEIKKDGKDGKTGSADAKAPQFTPLTTMLMNVAPKSAHELPELLLLPDQTKHAQKLAEIRASMPEDYELNYKSAYRQAQDSPGGSLLNGRPEARYEAYARAYAGCGNHVTTAYRRSYARLYEATACANLATDDQYAHLFETRPHDIIGRHVRLEALEMSRHAADLHKITCGEPSLRSKSFPPEEVWAFLPQGPFETLEQLQQSFVFDRNATTPTGSSRESAFAIFNNVGSTTLQGIVWTTHDDPQNLSIQLEPPIVPPTVQGTALQLEACFLMLDRLFACGYRRIQMALDAHDAVSRKVAVRLGFTLEGILHKHLIVKESSRDSSIYGLLNSDWKASGGGGGARDALFSKLYGSTALKADKANETREAEREEQEWNLNILKKKQEDKNGEESAGKAADTVNKQEKDEK